MLARNDVEDRLVVTRSYNSLELDRKRGVVLKSSGHKKIRDELHFYDDVPEDLKIFFPRVVGAQFRGNAGDDGSEVTIELEYYGYLDLGRVLVFGLLCSRCWDDVMERLSEVLQVWGDWWNGKEEGKSEHSLEMYERKTVREIIAFEKQSEEAFELCTANEVVFNGGRLCGFPLLWPILREYIHKWLVPYKSGFMHGDFCLSNILYDFSAGAVKCVDPRGSFGGKGILGDPRYDLAKLYHSVDGGYEFLAHDKFFLTRNDGQPDIPDFNLRHDACSEYPESALRAFEMTFFLGQHIEDIKSIQVIEGLLYLSMCARHNDNPDRQIAMFLTGLKILNDVQGAQR